MIDDAQLLTEFATLRSEQAFTELVRRHIDFVYRAALRRVGGDIHLAEDVTQSVFIALARDAGCLRDRRVLVGWLFSTTRHLSAQTVRTERRRREREQTAVKMNPLDHPLSHPPLADPFPPVLDDALDALSAQDRE